VPPCSQCLKRSIDDSNAEISNAVIENIATTTNGISNPSSKELVAISDENCRLNNLLETGMLKSLKGHQTLCDVLKKSILHKHPERKDWVSKENSMLMEPTGLPSNILK
jgi:hypothetical protein